MSALPKGIHGMKVLSTFSGMGGSSLGYKMAGLDVIGCVEIHNHAVATYHLNHPSTHIFHRDITELGGKEILKTLNLEKGELDLLDGSPPCQGFSTAGKRILQDDRNTLFRSFFRLVDELEPRNILIENVSGMIKGKMKYIAREIIQECKKRGYQTVCGMIKASSFGVAQMRPRVFFMGSKVGLPFFPKKTHHKIVTAKEALKNIDPITMPKEQTDHNKKMMYMMKENETGQAAIKRTTKKWHNKHFGLQKLAKNRPSRTIIKTYTGFFHWTNRPLSIEEALVLTGFPVDYKMVGTFRQKWARIGNSVSPPVAKAIGEMFLSIGDKS